jgi:hypothetical protein
MKEKFDYPGNCRLVAWLRTSSAFTAVEDSTATGQKPPETLRREAQNGFQLLVQIGLVT